MRRDLINFILIVILKLFSKVKISYKAKINPSIFKQLLYTSKSNINIREAILGSGVTLNEGVQFYGDPTLFGDVSIGRYTTVCGPATRICSGVNKVIIGNYCSIASNVIVQEYFHKVENVTTYAILNNVFKKHNLLLERTSKGDIIIEDDVWIGSNVSIMSGVKIGRGAVIGAGSVVVKDILPYTIVGGNPAKILKQRFDSKTIERLEISKWWLWPLEKVLSNESFFYNNDK